MKSHIKANYVTTLLAAWFATSFCFSHLYDHIKTISCLFLFSSPPPCESLSAGIVPNFPLNLRPIFGKGYKFNMLLLTLRVQFDKQVNELKKITTFLPISTCPLKIRHLCHQNTFPTEIINFTMKENIIWRVY